jgi:hypothetical protein
MRAFEKKAVVVVTTIMLAASQIGLAGVAFYAKQSTVTSLASEREQLRMLQDQLAQEVPQPGPAAEVRPVARWQLLTGPDVVATMQELQRLGDEAGVVFDGQKAMRSADGGKQSFLIAGHGKPSDVCGFVAAVEQTDRLMIVETGRLLPGGGDQVAFELGVATYHEGGKQ